MKLGAAYYPEHRGPARWAADYEKARAAGIRRVRAGGFAWSRKEPQPGTCHWDPVDPIFVLRVDLQSAWQPRRGLQIPSEHKIWTHWAWLERSIDLAAEHGVEIVLGTPTACPPIWLVERYPEGLPVNRTGRVLVSR